MKKFLSLLLAVCMIFSFTIFAYAEAPTTAQPQATGLIYQYSASVFKQSTMYIGIIGKTYGTDGVVKSGFIDIVIQRRASSSAAWGDYLDLDDYTLDTRSCVYDRELALPSNYQYRVYWKHYAKKNLLSVEKIKNYSNAVQM